MQPTSFEEARVRLASAIERVDKAIAVSRAKHGELSDVEAQELRDARAEADAACKEMHRAIRQIEPD
jgi:hypothetical protein